MNNENNTLVILIPGWAESEADTNCLPMQQAFVKTLKEHYPRLNIIILAFQYPYFKKTYPWYDTTVISFDGKNKGGVARLFRMREINVTLTKISSKNKIMGLLSFWYGECTAVGKNFADKNNLSHFCWIMGQDARKEKKDPGRIRANASELIALSDFLQDEFQKNHGVRPVHIIPPGTDVKQLAAAVNERDIDILGVGSLIPLKQYDIFIALIAEIKKKIPAVKAILAGAGPEKEKLEELIKKYELQQNITLTGELPHAEVLKLMQRSKLLLHPSSYEGFSGVCQESLASGAYVISFCKAMRQEIDHWNIAQSKEEMKQRTLSLLHDRQLDHKRVIPYTTDDTVKKVMELFNN